MDNTKKTVCGDRIWLLRDVELPIKALISAIIVVFGFAMAGALGQIYVHDILPRMEKAAPTITEQEIPSPPSVEGTVGDLFAESHQKIEKQGGQHGQGPTSQAVWSMDNEQFIWTLKWTHIHLFGMNMIFILFGPVTAGLNKGVRLRTWLVVLPFAGVLIDIAAMWLKNFVSPAFFWLHVPGGLMFGLVFVYVSLCALWEMWGGRQPIGNEP